jgi:nucleoside-diphosphate-sugar epimerase
MAPQLDKEVAIPAGATIFVTGVNGLVGSYIVDELLARGYKVRGAVRSVEKASWLLSYFEEKYGEAMLELVEVPDFTADQCYHDAVKGIYIHPHPFPFPN